MMAKFFHRAKQNQALVRNGNGGSMVSFSGMMVIPMLHVLETVDLSVRKIPVKKIGDNALIFRDGTKVYIQADFYMRLNRTTEDVLGAAQSYGCETASDTEKLGELLTDIFDQKMREFADRFDFKDISKSNERFKEEVLKQIGVDLNFFVLDDMTFRIMKKS